MLTSPRPRAAIGLGDDEATTRALSSLATYLLGDLGVTRPVPVAALEGWLLKFGLAVHREGFAGSISAIVWPKSAAVIVSDDLSEAEERFQLAHVIYHVLLDSASTEGWACSERTEAECRRADHGSKLLLAGSQWYGVGRLAQAAERFGVPEADLAEAMLDQV